MSISISEYEGKFVKTKVVKLEEGVEFEIRRVSPLDMWDEDVDQRKPQTPAKFMKTILIKGVVNPTLSGEKKEGCLNIKDLKSEHVNALTEAITEFSGYTKGGKPTDFLSQEKKD